MDCSARRLFDSLLTGAGHAQFDCALHPPRMSALGLRARRPSVAGVAFISLFVLCLLALYIGFETPINAPMTSLPGMARPARNQNYLFEVCSGKRWPLGPRLNKSQTVPGFFHQTIDATDSDAFDPVCQF